MCSPMEIKPVPVRMRVTTASSQCSPLVREGRTSSFERKRLLLTTLISLLWACLLSGCLGAGVQSPPPASAQAPSVTQGESRFTGQVVQNAPVDPPASSITAKNSQTAAAGSASPLESKTQQGDRLATWEAYDSDLDSNAPLPEPVASFTDLDRRFQLDAVRQYFVKNEHHGECLVVEGRVVNAGAEPVDLVEIEVSLLDAAGKSLASKRALGGVTLAISQLETFTDTDIEALLQDEAGILSANRNVRSGGNVPFMLVFFKPPKDVAEFAIRVVDALPAEI